MNRADPFLRSPRGSPGLALSLAVVGLAASGHVAARADEVCTAASTRFVAPVIELYTSEGCNSCPPADRWLSALKADAGIVALAFHVDYWDRLGWKDRFATAAYSERQAAQQASNGARFSYTPQIVADGRDRKDWPSLKAPFPSRPPAQVEIALRRDGDRFTATVLPAGAAPKRLAAYWAVTEQGHVSAVKAGENEGVTLQHDFVVREYAPVAPWAARGGSVETLHYRPAGVVDAAHPRSVNLVVVDAADGRPVQALKIDC